MFRTLILVLIVSSLSACVVAPTGFPVEEQREQRQASPAPVAGVSPGAYRCAPGTNLRKLDWEGHPQHGNEMCLPSEEVVSQQKVAHNNARCSSIPGTTWRKLDWPGHPQHGKFACIPSEEVIAKDKAAHAARN